MDIFVSLRSQFDAVFLVNGKLVEGGEIEYGQSSVVYVTVLPLDAVLLPYTVMMVGAMVKCNHTLAQCYDLGDNKYYLNLKARYNYVYSVQNSESVPRSVAESFFWLLKERKVGLARELMSAELSASVDDGALLSFFDGFKDIVCAEGDEYHLISDSNLAKLHCFLIKDGLIDNILEK